MLPMNHLPVLDQNARKPEEPDWGRATGNIADSKMVVEVLKSLVNDAVFLDEGAYSGALNVSSFQSKLQSANRRIHDMEHEATALRAEVDAKSDDVARLKQAHQEELDKRQQMHQEAMDQITELKAELENNAVVFKMHYQELITRNDEISRLNAIISSFSREPGADATREPQ